MKFLVLWELNPAGLNPQMVQAVMKMPDYAKKIKADNKLLHRFHTVGKHGGAWLYDVTSNEELERLLAMSPVYNFAHYEVLPLADMETPAEVLQPQ
jgi:muconolactone delta-isomerase